MKKFICLSTLFLVLTAYSQSKQINFDYSFNYTLKENKSDATFNKPLKVNYFFSNPQQTSLFEIITYGKNIETFVVKNGKIINTDLIGLERVLEVSENAVYSFDKSQSFNTVLTDNIELELMNKKGSFLNFNCDYYAVKSKSESQDLEGSQQLCFCIDTNNKVKNLKAIFPNSNIDGLILAFGNINYPDEEITLDQINQVDIKVDFDFDNEYNKLEAQYSEYIKQNDDFQLNDSFADSVDYASADDSYYYSNYYDDPLCNNYVYFDDLNAKTRDFAYQFKDVGCSLKNADSDYDGTPELTRDQAILIFKKQTEAIIKQAKKSKILDKKEAKELTQSFNKLINEAKNFVLSEQSDPTNYITEAVEPAWEEADSVYDYYNDYRVYQSDYKNNDIQTVSLAAESQFDETLKNYMPNYCDNLKEKIPDFKNQILKNHVYNLVGQICDLYLYENGGFVDYFGTIDSMRKSLLEIENLRVELSKSDTKMLNEYLNSLD